MLTNQNIKIGRRTWSTRDSEKRQKRLPSRHVKAGWIVASDVSSKSKCGSWTRLSSYAFLKNWTWACDQLKSSNLSADNFKENTRTQWVDTWARDTVRRNWSAETLFWQLSINQNMDVQYLILNIGMPVARADGRSGGRCMVTWLPNFLGWIDFLSYGASNWARDQIKYQRKTLNTTWYQWARDTLRWWWSAYTLVWQLSINLH